MRKAHVLLAGDRPGSDKGHGLGALGRRSRFGPRPAVGTGFRTGKFVPHFDEEPVVLAAASATHANERKSTFELLAMQDEFQAPLLESLGKACIITHLVSSLVPNLDG